MAALIEGQMAERAERKEQIEQLAEQLVIFELEGGAYGVNVAQVRSIIPLQEIVTVPGAPSFIEGVVNLRGAVTPTIDLRARFGLQAKLSASPNGRKAIIVVVELAKLQVGLIVDKVTEVTKVAEVAIESPSPLLIGVDTAYLRGIGKLKERLVILLELDQILSLDEQEVLAQTI